MEFDKIYDTYFNDVYLYIRKLSGDEHIAEEITSETFFRAMSSIESYRGDCDIRVWLCQIAKNCYYTSLKKSRRYTGVEAAEFQDLADPNALVAERIINHDEAKHIQKLLHTLQEPYKEVFMWRVYAELSFKQIGELFNKTDNWACVTYHRARRMLKSRLEELDSEK